MIYCYYHTASKLTACFRNKALDLEQEFYKFDYIYPGRWIASKLSELE